MQLVRHASYQHVPCKLSLLGKDTMNTAVKESVLSDTDMAIRDVLEEHGGPLTPKAVADRDDSLNYNYLRQRMPRLADSGVLAKTAEGYDLPRRVEATNLDNSEREDDVTETISYPLGRAGAGPGRTSHGDTLTVDKKLIRSEIGSVPDKDEAFWARVEGESMEPWLRDGTYAFALRQNTVTVPGRYVIWWGEQESEICCYLAKMSDSTLLLRKYGPEKEYTLRHKGDLTYEISSSETIRMEVRGRIIYPPSSARSILETVTDQMGKVLKEALHNGDS